MALSIYKRIVDLHYLMYLRLMTKMSHVIINENVITNHETTEKSDINQFVKEDFEN